MVDEKIYRLEDNINMILIEHVIYDGKRYLLLNKEGTEEVSIAYEDDGNLVFLDSDYKEYHNIALSLMTKLEKK